ncbi:MAG: glycosyltransferase [Bacteroidales bacterium]|nr:glycosyltransferase [Bacteroidales bacterium]
MRILHINTFDHAGGAARAAQWLHSGLIGSGHDSIMLVQHKSASEQAIYTKPGRIEPILKDTRWFLDALPLVFYPQRTTTHWATGWLPNRITHIIRELNPDIVNLHWICRGFISINELSRVLALGYPVVWTIHDSWPFTGGCHVPGECVRYRQSCGLCPQLSSKHIHDLSWLTLFQKRRKWQKHDFVVVTPSKWLEVRAKKSSLFGDKRIVTIPNGIDFEAFSGIDKQLARLLLRLPDSGKVSFLCGGINAYNDPNKGLHLLHQAIELLVKEGLGNLIELVFYGESESSTKYSFPVATTYLGALHDNVTLRIAYSCADYFILPSLQENLPNSIIESLACGVPVIAFATGGIPEIIRDGHNGYLARAFDVEDLVRSIKCALKEPLKPFLDSRFFQTESVKCYLALYNEVMKCNYHD